VEALRLASSDERVKGVMATFGANQRYQGLAQIQELRNAVTAFRWVTEILSPIERQVPAATTSKEP
jgi:hypothetical protein